MRTAQRPDLTWLGRVARGLLASLVGATIAACGGSSSESGPAPAPVTPTPTPTTPTSTITVRGGDILATNGRVLTLRGINLQYGDNPQERLTSIAPIASTGANAIRLQLRSNTTAAQLRSALDEIVAHGLVAVVMYWEEDVTCQSGSAGFATAMTRWTQTWKDVLSDSKYASNLILNIANEWGSTGSIDTYRSTYRSAIQSLRAAGYRFPLMIDAPGCGQAYSAFANGGAQLIATADTEANLIFSVHAYWSYQTASQIEAAAQAVRATGYPFVWGEFGQRAFQADIGQATDHRYLMKHANEQSIGYIAWSWYGNGGDSAALDMSGSPGAVALTAYGLEVVEGTAYQSNPVAGIRGTAVPLGQ